MVFDFRIKAFCFRCDSFDFVIQAQDLYYFAVWLKVTGKNIQVEVLFLLAVK